MAFSGNVDNATRNRWQDYILDSGETLTLGGQRIKPKGLWSLYKQYYLHMYTRYIVAGYVHQGKLCDSMHLFSSCELKTFQNSNFEHFEMRCQLEKRVTIEEVMHEVTSLTLHLSAVFHWSVWTLWTLISAGWRGGHVSDLCYPPP